MKRTSPESIKGIFKPYIFPCRQDKSPALIKGETWDKTKEQTKKLVRGGESDLYGIDCGQSGLTIVDIDCYKPDFLSSPASLKYAESIRKRSKFSYKTPSGGEHHIFKGWTTSQVPCPGVEVKGIGGYCCLYSNPAEGFKNFDSWYEALPYFSEVVKPTTTIKEPKFGPGKNNYAAPFRITGNRAKNKQAIIEAVLNNKGRETETDKILDDILNQIVRKEKEPKEAESEFYKPEKGESLDLLDAVPDENFEFVDTSNKVIQKGVLSILTGAKSSGKSSGMISYLLQQGVTFFYFSFKEVTKAKAAQFNKLAKDKKWTGRLIWFDTSRLDDNEEAKKFIAAIEKYKPEAIFEDPIFESSMVGKIETLKIFLGARANTALKYNLAWIVARNYSKSEYKEKASKVAGFADWTNMARAVFLVQRVAPNSKTSVEYINKKAQKFVQRELSVFHYLIGNSETPKNSILLDQVKDTTWPTIPVIGCEPVDRPTDIDKFCSGPSVADKERKETNEWKALYILDKEQNGLQRKEWIEQIMEKEGVSKATAGRIISKLKDDFGYVEGGGKDKKAPYKITKKGKDYLNA